MSLSAELDADSSAEHKPSILFFASSASCLASSASVFAPSASSFASSASPPLAARPLGPTGPATPAGPRGPRETGTMKRLAARPVPMIAMTSATHATVFLWCPGVLPRCRGPWSSVVGGSGGRSMLPVWRGRQTRPSEGDRLAALAASRSVHVGWCPVVGHRSPGGVGLRRGAVAPPSNTGYGLASDCGHGLSLPDSRSRWSCSSCSVSRMESLAI